MENIIILSVQVSYKVNAKLLSKISANKNSLYLSFWILRKKVSDGLDEWLENVRIEEEIGSDDQVEGSGVEPEKLFVVIAPS